MRTAANLDSATGVAVADTLDSDPEESKCEAEVVMDRVVRRVERTMIRKSKVGGVKLKDS